MALCRDLTAFAAAALAGTLEFSLTMFLSAPVEGLSIHAQFH